MANNGTLKLQADESTYKGEFHSLDHSFPLTMVPNDDAKTQRAPTYLVFSGKTRLGAAWEETSVNTGTVYYTVQLKDPRFGTLYLKLFQDKAEGGTYNIVFD
jgi:uncharacterized protein (DUF736 family)